MQVKPLILCADDDPDILEDLRYILEGAGYQVITAKDGVEAIDVARTRSIDLAVLDIRMPGSSGIEVLEELKANTHRCSSAPLHCETSIGIDKGDPVGRDSAPG